MERRIRTPRMLPEAGARLSDAPRQTQRSPATRITMVRMLAPTIPQPSSRSLFGEKRPRRCGRQAGEGDGGERGRAEDRARRAVDDTRVALALRACAHEDDLHG